MMDDPDQAEHWQGVADLAALIASGSVAIAVAPPFRADEPMAKLIARTSVDIALAILDEIGARASAEFPRFKVGDRVRLRKTDREGEVVDVGDNPELPSVRVQGLAEGAADLSWYPVEYLELVVR